MPKPHPPAGKPANNNIRSPSDIYHRVWQALRERQHVVFEYKDRMRDACPIILGYAGDGREAMKAFQVGGAASGPLPVWRDFYLDEIRELNLEPGPWREGHSHKRAQAFVKFVDVDANIPDTLTRTEPLRFGSSLLRAPRLRP